MNSRIVLISSNIVEGAASRVSAHSVGKGHGQAALAPKSEAEQG